MPPPRPGQLQLLSSPDPWVVVLKGQPAPYDLYGMTPGAYSLFALDLAKIAKWMGDANARIDWDEAQP